MQNADIPVQAFRKNDIRGIAGDDLTEANTRELGRAIGTYLRRRFGTKVVVGRDNRLSSPNLQRSLIEGLLSTGCAVTNINLSTSPLLYATVATGQFDGGVNVTASHSPSHFNGFKIVGSAACPVAGSELESIFHILQAKKFSTGIGRESELNPSNDYLARIESLVCLHRKLRVVIDAGNGVAGRIAPKIARRLGAEVFELNCKLDGRFPNHDPNPEIAGNLTNLMKHVKEVDADIGIAFDTDGDRLGVVDETGSYVLPGHILVLLARDFLERNKGATIAVDVMMPQVVIEYIERCGGKTALSKTGHAFVKEMMQKQNIMLGGEASGHFYVFENYLPIDDALFAACRLLSMITQNSTPLSHSLSMIPSVYSTNTVQLPCSDRDKYAIVKAIIEVLRQSFVIDETDGARIVLDRAWAIVRASNTGAAIVVRAEGFDSDSFSELINTLYGILSTFSEIDTTPLSMIVRDVHGYTSRCQERLAESLS